MSDQDDWVTPPEQKSDNDDWVSAPPGTKPSHESTSEAIANSPVGRSVNYGVTSAADVMGDIINPFIGGKYKDQTPTPDLDSLRSKGWSKTTWPERIGAVEEALMTSPTGKILGIGAATPAGAVTSAALGEANQAAEEKLGIPHQYSQAIETLLPFALKSSGEAAAENTEKTSQEPPPPLPPDEGTPQPYVRPVFDSDAALSSISKEYGNQLENAGKYYDFMRTLGSGKGAKFAEGARDALDDVISDVESDPFHEGRPTLSSLKRMSAKLASGDLDLNDTVDLKQFLNTKFNPGRFLEAKDSPYVTLGNATDRVLQEASRNYPDFGEAKALADKNWVNNVAMPFRNNDVLQKFWKPDDYYAHKSVESGIADDLPDETHERADQLVSKIKTPAQLDAVTRVLPADQAQLLRLTKLRELQAAGGRLSNAGKALYNAITLKWPSALRNVADVINPEYTRQQQALMDAAGQPSPRLTAKYADQFDELQQMAGNPRFSILEQKALPAPSTPLALPAPERPMVSENGIARPMNDAEVESANARRALMESVGGNDISANPAKLSSNLEQAAMDSERERNQSLGFEPGNHRAVQERENPSTELGQLQKLRESQTVWDKTERNLLDKGYTHKQILNMLGKRPSSFKRGGAVNTSPTEAQKAAGNYKKDHVELYGLPITIENPKGSIRSGKDRDGKEWKVRMPAAYGYFKRTTGADSDHVDCYIGPNTDSKRVWILDQKDADTGKFDEHKCFVGFKSKPQVLAIYRKAFSDGKANKRIHAVTEVTLEQLKDWLKSDMKAAA